MTEHDTQEGRPADRPLDPRFQIQLDRQHYTVTLASMTGLQLRSLATPPIAPERDLFEVVPGGPDRKIGDDDAIEMRNGLRLFTAPALITPGCNT